jgi:hypothetical protein
VLLMADWIKMRTGLLTNPRVIRMARLLLQNPEFMDWMCPGRACARSDDAVTKRDIPVVTRVVVGTLLGTWGAVNGAAGSDGVLRHSTLLDVDEMACVPGFGAALKAVDWLRELPDGAGVQFINFEEHNSPQKERSLTSKSSAERMKALRERQRQAVADGTLGDCFSDGSSDGEVTSQSDDRVEKKREEKKKKEAKASSSAAKLPPCPHTEILKLFAEKLPTLTQPKAEVWHGSAGEDALRARWKWLLTTTRAKDGTRYATNAQEGLDWLGRFFDYVADSDFLMGRTGDFKCTLQWLAKKENFGKVVQGNYVNKT